MNTQGTKSDFLTKFDRLYATQKYIAAFDLCIQNVKTSSMDEVQKKAELVIPKLKGNLELSNVDKFTYDDHDIMWLSVFSYVIVQKDTKINGVSEDKMIVIRK